MKILVTGAKGVLGSALVRAGEGAGFTVVPLSREELDITDAGMVEEATLRIRPDAVVNCAAFTDVDGAQHQPQEALRVNRDGARNLAMAGVGVGARTVQISTDYVFDGKKGRPYLPTDQPAPLNLYGITKLAGEVAVREVDQKALVVRTSWIFGEGGPGFVAWVAQALLQEGPPLRVVADERSRPTFAPDLAMGLLSLLRAGVTGCLHLANRGECTRLELAQEIRSILDSPRTLLPTTAEAFGAPARRPAYSVLDLSQAEVVLGSPLPPWRESLRRYLER
jgi:dTDP-4-dehydrorhamnose reductase